MAPHHNIVEQHFDLSGMPPSAFDFVEEFDVAAATPAFSEPATRQPLKIARAKTGASEIRLLLQKCKGKADLYILEEAELQPYIPRRTDLLKGTKPMAAKQAYATFEKKVAEKYPAETLRNNKVVARYDVIL